MAYEREPRVRRVLYDECGRGCPAPSRWVAHGFSRGGRAANSSCPIRQMREVEKISRSEKESLSYADANRLSSTMCHKLGSGMLKQMFSDKRFLIYTIGHRSPKALRHNVL